MKFLYLVLFKIGILQHRLFQTTNKYSYIAFRKLYGLTNGEINENYSRKIANKRGKYNFPEVTKGVTGTIDSERLEKIISEIKENGYFIFPEKLSQKICERLIQFATNTPARTINENIKPDLKAYDIDNPVAPMYKFVEEDLMKNEDLQNLLCDVNFMRLAQAYLGCKPLNTSLIMWWSSLYKKVASSKAAQLYHFDMDHPKFIKFFIYLKDVDSNAGPHCFVSGSHKNKPAPLRADRRFNDEEVSAHYEPSQLLEICGPQGTIVAVDTSGIHKGKPPVDKDRLIVQLEFTNSFFGQKTNRYKMVPLANNHIKEIYNNYQGVFERLQN